MHDGQLMSKREDYTYEVLGSNKPHSDTARTISVNAGDAHCRSYRRKLGSSIGDRAGLATQRRQRRDVALAQATQTHSARGLLRAFIL